MLFCLPETYDPTSFLYGTLVTYRMNRCTVNRFFGFFRAIYLTKSRICVKISNIEITRIQFLVNRKQKSNQCENRRMFR